MSSSRSEKAKEILTESTTVETKQKGTVKWHVYAEYLRAGVIIVGGILLVLILSSVREAVYIFSNWWLAT